MHAYRRPTTGSRRLARSLWRKDCATLLGAETILSLFVEASGPLP